MAGAVYCVAGVTTAAAPPPMSGLVTAATTAPAVVVAGVAVAGTVLPPGVGNGDMPGKGGRSSTGPVAAALGSWAAVSTAAGGVDPMSGAGTAVAIAAVVATTGTTAAVVGIAILLSARGGSPALATTTGCVVAAVVAGNGGNIAFAPCAGNGSGGLESTFIRFDGGSPSGTVNARRGQKTCHCEPLLCGSSQGAAH